jgi:hypothetical protein
MNTMNRRALLSFALLAALAFDYSGSTQVANAADATADARPDFSGVWLPDSRASGRLPEQRPFTPEMAELRAQWTKATSPIDLTRDDEHTSCIPYTLPYILTTITQYPYEIVMTPRRVYVFTEVYGQVRRIDLDGTPVSPETLPTRMGVSRGRWEGSQLVIETTHILPEHEGGRFPGSPKTRIVERWSLADGGPTGKQLINEVTMHDPLVYREPIPIRMVYKWAEGVEVGEYICNQDLWDQHRSGTDSVIPWR